MKTFKTIWITAIAILGFLALCNAQEIITLGLYQDARLGLLGDDHGNKAGTLDAKLDVTLQGKQFEWYYYEMRVQLEHAQLSGGDYTSWQVLGGWVLNQLFLDNLEAGAYLTIGAIHRFGGSYGTYGITADLSYKLTDNLKLSFLGQVINRSDLVDRYNINNPMKGSFYVGLKYNIVKL